MRRPIRREALERLATLSASSPHTSENDVIRLSKRCPGPRASTTSSTSSTSSNASVIPITLPELEALSALCKAAPRAARFESAAQFLPQIAAYLPLCHSIALDVSRSFPISVTSPWETLTYNLADSVLSLGLRHTSLRQHASSTTARYLDSWLRAANTCLQNPISTGDYEDEDDDSLIRAIGQLVTLSTSLLGFLNAASENAQFWLPKERLLVLRMLKDALSEKFSITLETALSIIRNSRNSEGEIGNWKKIIYRYSSLGRPLGALLLRLAFMKLITAFASLEVAASLEIEDTDELARKDILQVLLSQRYSVPPSDTYTRDPTSAYIVEQLTDIATNELKQLEDGSDYIQLSSPWHRQLGSTTKAFVFTSLLCCAILDESAVDADDLRDKLETLMHDHEQILDDKLAVVIFKSIAILANASPEIGSQTSSSLAKILVHGGLDSKTSSVITNCLAIILNQLPQDVTITTLYSLGNSLSLTRTTTTTTITQTERQISSLPSFESAVKNQRDALNAQKQTGGSVVSFGPSSHHEEQQQPSHYFTTIEAIVHIACTCNEAKIIALALTMLSQKIGKLNLEVDAKIITESAVLGVHSAVSELRSLLKLYSKLCHDGLVQGNATLLEAVMKARLFLSQGIRQGTELFEVYLMSLLESIVSKGDAHNAESKLFNSKPLGDMELAAQEIAQLLRPLAALGAANASLIGEKDLGIEGLTNLQRDAWFNAVAHGFTLHSPYGKQYAQELQTLAQFSMPLIAEDRADQLESDIELNTTLRRGKSNDATNNFKRYLFEQIPKAENDIRNLNYSELVFLTSAHLVENLRAMSGDCTKVLTYFLDPRLRSGSLGNCMVHVALGVVKQYLLNTKSAKSMEFTSPHVAEQLALFFAGCCHRIKKVQSVAIDCVDLILINIPSSLCQKVSLYALFELLTILWVSCLEQETEEYQWNSKFTSIRGNVEIEMSDDYEFRHETLKTFHAKSKAWVSQVLDIAPLDIKGLIQTYLSEYVDDGSYDHVSLGRSFALEMGGMIPSTDQRLKAVPDLNPSDMPINTSSDFIVQYSIRQEYRHIDSFQDDVGISLHGVHNNDSDVETSSNERTLIEARKLLNDIENGNQVDTSVKAIRDVLRRAGALLCRSKGDEGDVIHHLVRIPFSIFTKNAIKLGISLWTGVIKESPRTESRILAEISEGWEDTIRKRKGLFDPRLKQADPFFAKLEFAPSDRELITKRQHWAYDMIAPHVRLLQFFSSHFNATRFGIPHVQRLYQRLMTFTLIALGEGIHHPLAREAVLSALLLASKVLRFSTNLESPALWRFKDRLLSAGLAWFSDSPKWSFGGNKLQLRAETHLISDFISALDQIRHIGYETYASRRSLWPKHELLSMLLSSEANRLHVWLYPIESEHKASHTFHQYSATESKLSSGLKTAWVENPDIAVQLAKRYHHYDSITSSLRHMILEHPEKVVHSSDALELIIGTSIAPDINVQLKHLLYWNSVNPITAVSYFLPAYGQNPFIIQYAMRALESHHVDTTFFYVPQIVQTLRYDALGYVERYIVETAKISQLFAHQIIWNIKANAYKDEEATIPDPAKSVFEQVMNGIIESFTADDKDFYEREFSFFNEVTGISGKLKPLIKKSKPEKKQKIEEELRKIKLEKGVYLPSNPDGVVVGIDRTSGKPLQSHAKAPYMATFRIKKEIVEETPENEERLIKSNGAEPNSLTYEVWQSAIFKVGDDCRQDVLALQMIAAFRGIYHSVGLDVYVYPNRVTATAPGCGVIDVLPNSISRDMLGREAVNGLYDYFVSKYGGENSIAFQAARNSFVKSMAAYSVITYLLQFKDRHNGNIMIDDTGHILHIDFGFCFDIAPGGVKFERAPFKLTQEMVAVMGGISSQSYRWFEELCIKSFLACRQHSEHLISMVAVMLDSGLPCFKPLTIKHFRERFVLERNEKEAADFMRDLVKKSLNNLATKGYDQFQLLTNGIPY